MVVPTGLVVAVVVVLFYLKVSPILLPTLAEEAQV
jgi:hypothetical protein